MALVVSSSGLSPAAAVGSDQPLTAETTSALRTASSPAPDQDPIFDHANGTKTSVTTSAGVITPPTGCKYVRISSDVNIYVNTNNAAAVDDGTSILIFASQPETIPVQAGVQVRALSASGTATVRCMPLKVR